MTYAATDSREQTKRYSALGPCVCSGLASMPEKMSSENINPCHYKASSVTTPPKSRVRGESDKVDVVYYSL